MYTRGDDTKAFGQQDFLTLNVTVPEGETVSKAILKINNCFSFEYINPSFPVKINLTKEHEQALKDDNNCDLILYDGEENKLTVPCIAYFNTRKGV